MAAVVSIIITTAHPRKVEDDDARYEIHPLLPPQKPISYAHNRLSFFV